MVAGWEALYAGYLAAKAEGDTEKWLKVLTRVRNVINAAPEHQASCVVTALADAQKKWMVAHAFSVSVGKEAHPFPIYLVGPALRAGVYERDPSFNKHFILPCMTSVGYRAVNEALLEYVEHGTNYEVAGAVNALYWASFRFKYRADVTKWFWNPETQEPFWEKLEPECLAEYNATRDVRVKIKRTFLETFVATSDLDIRRTLIASLNINPEEYPPELRPLALEAMDIATNHPDEYIQNRVQLKLGKERLIKPLPHRP